MIETTIVWHKATEERPAASGYYIVACNHSGQPYVPYVTKTAYSKKHDKFNCADKDADARYAFEPDYWADTKPLEVLV